VAAFQQGIRQHRPTEPLVLNSDEINALVASTPEAAPLRDKVYFRVDGNQLKGDLSIPMEALGLPIFRGRYLNGTATFGVDLHEGHLLVIVQSLTVKGKALPKVYMDRIRSQNLAQQLNVDPRATIAMDQIERLRIENGTVVVVPRDFR